MSILLGDMLVRYRADITDLTVKTAAAAADVEGFSGAASVAGMAAAGVLLATGVAAIGFGAASVKMASEYQRSMNMVQALTGANSQEMSKYDAGLKQLAVTAGVAPKELANGLYYVMSAGYKGAQAMDVLKLSTEDAKIGMTDQTTTANALTTVLKAFSVQAGDVNRVNGEMLQTVTLGKMTMTDYAGSIGKASSTSMQFHVSMENMNASIATMTSNGIPSAHQAVTNYTQAVSVMYANINTVSKSLQKNGIEFNVQKFNLMDYQDKIKTLNTALVEAADKHVKVTGVTKQAASAIQILSQHSKEFTTDLASLSDKQAMGQKTAQAWAITQSGFGQTMDRLHAVLDVVMISIGQKLLPVLTQAGQSLVPLIQQFGEWITKSGVLDQVAKTLATAIATIPAIIQKTISVVTSVINWYNQWKGVIQVVASVILAFYIPAMIQAGVEAVISGIKIAVNFVKSIIMAGVEGYQSGLKVATFIVSMVQTGTAAVVNGAKVVASFVASMVESAAKAVWAAAQITASFIASMFKAGLQAVITAGQFLASLIPAIISFVAESLVAAATAIPAMLAGFAAWAIGAWSAAVATIAATWPILLIIAAIALLVVGIYLLVTHWGQVVAFLQGTWQRFTGWIMGALHALGTFFAGVWAWIMNAAKIAFIALILIIGGPILWIALLIYTHWNQIKYFLAIAWAWVLHTASALWTNVIGVFQNAWTGITNAVLNIWKWINDFFGGLPAKMLQFGINLIQGLINGITSMIGAIGNTMNTIVGTIGSFLPHSPAKQGELSHLDEYGPSFVKGFAGGITRSQPILQTAMNTVLAPMAYPVKPSASGVATAASSSSSASQGQTFILEMNSVQIAQVTAHTTDKLVRLKLGSQGRAA